MIPIYADRVRELMKESRLDVSGTKEERANELVELAIEHFCIEEHEVGPWLHDMAYEISRINDRAD